MGAPGRGCENIQETDEDETPLFCARPSARGLEDE